MDIRMNAVRLTRVGYITNILQKKKNTATRHRIASKNVTVILKILIRTPRYEKPASTWPSHTRREYTKISALLPLSVIVMSLCTSFWQYSGSPLSSLSLIASLPLSLSRAHRVWLCEYATVPTISKLKAFFSTAHTWKSHSFYLLGKYPKSSKARDNKKKPHLGFLPSFQISSKTLSLSVSMSIWTPTKILKPSSLFFFSLSPEPELYMWSTSLAYPEGPLRTPPTKWAVPSRE